MLNDVCGIEHDGLKSHPAVHANAQLQFRVLQVRIGPGLLDDVAHEPQAPQSSTVQDGVAGKRIDEISLSAGGVKFSTSTILIADAARRITKVLATCHLRA